MNELTERLTLEQSVVMGGADPAVEELRDRTGEMGYVLVKFTETRGGTELGFPLDRAATDLSQANVDDGTGTVHVEGRLVLNDDPVRCIADIDLATLGGTGRLALEEKPRRQLSDRGLSCQTAQRAWVGDRRAARMAGSSPARAPMITVAARPPAQAWGGMTTASPWPRA